MEGGRIITLSGPSAVGKTTIARELLQANPEWKLLISLTTRGPRPSDIPGEYKYNVSMRRFDELEREGKFVWTVCVHGNKYGTLSKLVDDALDAPCLLKSEATDCKQQSFRVQSCESPVSSQAPLAHTSIMLPTPQVIPVLVEYAQGRGQVTSFFVTLERDVLRARLEKREKEEYIESTLPGWDKRTQEEKEEKRREREGYINRRLDDCDMWTQEARESEIPFIFIDNSGTIEEAVEQVLQNLIGSS